MWSRRRGHDSDGTGVGRGAPELYRALRHYRWVTMFHSTIGELTLLRFSACADNHWPKRGSFVYSAWRGAINRCLYLLLRGDTVAPLAGSPGRSPYFLLNLAGDLFPIEDAAERLIDLVDLAVHARPDTKPLVAPARYHVFARALEGAFVCLNADSPPHAEDHPRLFLTRQEVCPCARHVVEMSVVRCGQRMVGQIVNWRPPDRGLVCTS